MAVNGQEAVVRVLGETDPSEPADMEGIKREVLNNYDIIFMDSYMPVMVSTLSLPSTNNLVNLVNLANMYLAFTSIYICIYIHELFMQNYKMYTHG